jgi:uncharacterized delta-60 repeat protein
MTSASRDWQRLHLALVASCLAALVALGAAPPAFAKAGDLDPSFGENGRVIGHRWTLVDMATLADGRTVVATENALFAYQSNGRPDRSFGDNGAVEPLSPEGGKLTIEDIAVDGRGRIVAAGSAAHADPTATIGYSSHAAIVRYLPDGELDGGFGGNGIVFTDLGLPPPARPPKIPSYAQVSPAAEVRVLGVAVDSGERIVLTGTRAATYTGTKSATFVPFHEAFVARLTEGGSQDASFGENGTRPLGGLSSIGRPAMDRQAGVYFVAPRQATSEYSERPLVKVVGHLTASGTVDQDFGKGGWRALTNNSSESDLDVTLDRKGRLLIYRQGSGAGIARFKPNGSVDRSFGRDGMATIVPPQGEVIVSGLAVTGSGAVLVAATLVTEPASTRDEFKRRLLLARLTHQGKLGRRFGNRGSVVTKFGAESAAEGRAVLADGDGHALVGGVLESSRFILARYLLGR